MKRCHTLSALSFCAALVVPALAGAQGSEDRNARVVAQQGQEALHRNDYQTAADRFQRAESIHHDPSYTLGLARALVGLRKFAEARGEYQRILAEDLPKGSKLVEAAQAELDTVVPHVSWITIEVQGQGDAKVELDGHDVPNDALGHMQAIDAGKHVVKVVGDGLDASETFIVATGEERIVKLSLNRTEAAGAPAAAPEPAPAAPAAPDAAPPPHHSGAQKALGITALVIGGVGLTTGVVLGLVAASKESQLATECTDKQCLPPSHALLDSYHAFGTGSTIAFGVGGAGLVAGIVLLATAPSSSPEKAPQADHAPDASVHPYVGLGSAGFAGRF